MPAISISALAIHVSADIASAGPDRRWPPLHAMQDTAQRMMRICSELGIADQRTLAGEHATVAALLYALGDAGAALADDGLIVLTFSGHTVRGDGPIETARWCLFDAGIELSQVAGELARLPPNARAIVICDSCYASAIASVLIGPQEVVVLASCGEDQTMVDRVRSEPEAHLHSCASYWSTIRLIASGRLCGPTPLRGGPARSRDRFTRPSVKLVAHPFGRP